MKKFKSLFLCLVLSSIFVLTGCSKEIDSATLTNIGAISDALVAEITPDSVDKNALVNIEDDEYDVLSEKYVVEKIRFANKDAFVGAINSCISAEEEAGKMQAMSAEVYVSSKKDGYVATKIIKCANRNVNMNITFDMDLNVTDITFSPVYTMGESMTKAALNTLLGMGSVFSVLILIMFIIYLFGIIPKIQKASADKKAAKEKASTEQSVDKTIANIVEKEEGELVDDYELVAVISAAIAAYEGNSSTDGFVVRSIKKSQSKKWQNAQY